VADCLSSERRFAFGVLYLSTKEQQMTKRLTKDTLFIPAPSRRETKSDITDRAAREILAEEAARSRAKTVKLRAARIKLEAREA
jgi:small subunit ribosomal protein S21